MQAELRVTSFPNVTAYLLILDLYKNTSLAAPGALAHRLQRRTAGNTYLPA